MQDDIQEKVFKLLTVDNFYFLFSIIFIIAIVKYKNYLDVSYFLLVTFYYIRLKLHRRHTI